MDTVSFALSVSEATRIANEMAGADIKSVEDKGTDTEGNHLYLWTFSNNVTFMMKAPKGDSQFFMGVYETYMALQTANPSINAKKNQFAYIFNNTTNEKYFCFFNGTMWEQNKMNSKIEMKNDGTNILWRMEGGTWTTLIPVASITGKDGVKGDKGDKGDTIAGIKINGDDIVISVKDNGTGVISDLALTDAIKAIRNGLRIDGYSGSFNFSTPLPAVSVVEGQWWRTKDKIGTIGGMQLPINSIVTANKTTQAATDADFDLYPSQYGDVISKCDYYLKDDNVNTNEDGNFMVKIGENGKLGVYDYEGDKWALVGEIADYTNCNDFGVKEGGGLFLEIPQADKSVYYARVAGAATQENTIAFGDPHMSTIIVSKDNYISSVFPNNSNQILPINTIFTAEKQIETYSFPVGGVKGSSVNSINIKLAENVSDYYVCQIDNATGKIKYESSPYTDFRRGKDPTPLLAGDAPLKSWSPFMFVEGETYTVTIKFPRPTKVMGAMLGDGTFIPYAIVLLDYVTKDKLIGETQIDSKLTKIKADGYVWVKGDGTKAGDIGVFADSSGIDAIQKLPDGTYTRVNYKDISIGAYPSLIAKINSLEGGRIEKGQFDPTVDKLDKFRDAKVGWFWKVIKDGVFDTKALRLGDIIVCTKEIIGMPFAGWDSLTVESGAAISKYGGATATTDGTAGLMPTPLKGQQNYLPYGNGSWEELHTFTPATATTDGTAGGIKPTKDDFEKVLMGKGFSTLPTMVGATLSANGKAGMCSAPLIADQKRYWRGDGTFADIDHNLTINKQGGFQTNFYHSDQAINMESNPTWYGLNVNSIFNPPSAKYADIQGYNSFLSVQNGGNWIGGIKPINPLYTIGNGSLFYVWDSNQGYYFYDYTVNQIVSMEKGFTHANLKSLLGGSNGNYYHSNQAINTDSNVVFNKVNSTTTIGIRNTTIQAPDSTAYTYVLPSKTTNLIGDNSANTLSNKTLDSSCKAVTQAVNDMTDNIATTKFVLGQGCGDMLPKPNAGNGDTGTSGKFSRADHYHPATATSNIRMGMYYLSSSSSTSVGNPFGTWEKIFDTTGVSVSSYNFTLKANRTYKIRLVAHCIFNSSDGDAVFQFYLTNGTGYVGTKAMVRPVTQNQHENSLNECTHMIAVGASDVVIQPTIRSGKNLSFIYGANQDTHIEIMEIY